MLYQYMTYAEFQKVCQEHLKFCQPSQLGRCVEPPDLFKALMLWEALEATGSEIQLDRMPGLTAALEVLHQINPQWVRKHQSPSSSEPIYKVFLRPSLEGVPFQVYFALEGDGKAVEVEGHRTLLYSFLHSRSGDLSLVGYPEPLLYLPLGGTFQALLYGDRDYVGSSRLSFYRTFLNTLCPEWDSRFPEWEGYQQLLLRLLKIPVTTSQLKDLPMSEKWLPLLDNPAILYTYKDLERIFDTCNAQVRRILPILEDLGLIRRFLRHGRNGKMVQFIRPE